MRNMLIEGPSHVPTERTEILLQHAVQVRIAEASFLDYSAVSAEMHASAHQ